MVGMTHFIIIIGTIRSTTTGTIRMVLGTASIGTCPTTAGIKGRSTVIRGTTTITGIGSRITPIINTPTTRQTGAPSITDREGVLKRTGLHKA